MAVTRVPVVIGETEARSNFMSNKWVLTSAGNRAATLTREPTRHTSYVVLADGTDLVLAPDAWGTVVAMSGDTEVGRATRTSWLGRSWEVSGPTFSANLTSDPIPRRWKLRLGREEVGQFSGGVLSYNRLHLHSVIAVPVVVVALAWHVLARPWEAAAAPGVMVPNRGSKGQHRVHG
ncbi:hypothetical protein HQ535_04720 [bacterium]|nr:hypothetical protein [bacterium]